MPRSGVEARERLRRAALERFRDQGYDATTVADIATRAGVTQRTFYRHFGDKREVLFDVEQAQQQALAAALEVQPDHVEPLQAVVDAFRAMAPAMEAQRDLVAARHQVVIATPELHERELAKAAALAAVVEAFLADRGVTAWRSALFAQVATAVLGQAVHTWVEDPSAGLDDLLVRGFVDVRDLAGLTVRRRRRSRSAP